VPAPEPQATPTADISQPATSEKPVSPDIINLANNTDLSIETIAHEANRIHQKEEQLPEQEVVISLR
jgi:Holliday junction resolvase